MLPAGFMAKRVASKPGWLAANVLDGYSVSGCISPFFSEYIDLWRHNGYWLFDSLEVLEQCIAELEAPTDVVTFYYEVHALEFDGDTQSWSPFAPEPSFETKVQVPATKNLEGFDVVSFVGRCAPECSPLSCNGLAAKLAVNAHCLMDSFEAARAALEGGAFRNAEPGPYRIFAIYTVG